MYYTNHNFYFESFSVCDDGELRIVDYSETRTNSSYGSMEGSVEICISNTYGGICDTFWDNLDALVVCKQLGFSTNGIHAVVLCHYMMMCCVQGLSLYLDYP